MKVCAEPGCPELTGAGRCPTHEPAPWANSNRRKRLPTDWSAVSRLVLERDRHECYLCGDIANEVDHVVNNDDHRPENLAAICRDCHRRKTAAESARARRRTPYA